MQTHELKSRTRRKSDKTVGRGGKRGKTSGRGTKGQRARSGHKIRPEVRDLIKKLPKLRGRGKNSNKSIVLGRQAINLSKIEKHFKDGETVSPATLAAKRIVTGARTGRRVIILATGELTKKVMVEGCIVSASAVLKINKVGGTVK